MLKRRSDIPGFQEGGANVDPVSGNEVPTGSMPEEVRDDIDAKLSPGEFVLPADVVRFIGLERLMKMRDEAKKGLQRMSEIGQMGNADEVGEASNGTYEDEGFESEIDDILSEIEAEENGRDVNEQTEVMMAEGGVAVGTKTNQTTTAGRPVYRTAEGDNVSELSITVPFKGFWANVTSIHNGVKYDEDQIVEMLDKGKIKPTSVHESIKEAVDAAKARSAGLLDKPEMAQGGFMKSGTDLTKAPKNPVFDVRYYKNAEGSVMYITHINGKPMTPIPEGYKAVTQEEAQKVGQKAEEAAKAETPKLKTDESGDADTTLNKEVEKFLDKEAREQAEFDEKDRSKEGPREQRMGKVSNVMETIAKWATPYGTVRNVMDFLKGPERQGLPAPVGDIGRPFLTETSKISMTEAAAADAYSRAQSENLGDDASSRAAASAAEAVSRGVDPASAIQAAIEAEQDVRDRSGIGDIFSSRGSSTVSPSSTPATTTGVPVGGTSITSRSLTTEETDSGSWSGPGGEASWGGGSAVGPDWNKGGLVNKRQYPSKKKRGKGIASAKS
jgi:Arc/MetJ-type ribon-helix-helix transcriptional regulator